MSLALRSLFYFGIFFPFVIVTGLNLDSQPTSLLAGVLLLFIFREFKFNKKLVPIILCGVTAFILFLISSSSLNSLRDLTIYFSLFVIPLITYRLMSRHGSPSVKVVLLVNVIYLFVASIQQLYLPQFGASLINNMPLIVGGRGVNGLAPEPTFYATFLSFLFIYTLINFDFNKVKFLLLLELFQIFFFTRSSTVILVLGISTFLYLIWSVFKLRIRLLFLLIFSAAIFIPLLFLSKPMWISTRPGVLFTKAVSSPSSLLKDESINLRFMHATLPIYSIFKNNGVPGGYNTFGDFIIRTKDRSHFYRSIDFYNIKKSPRIMSGYGMPIYHLGLIGLLIPYCVYLVFKPFLKIDKFVFAFIFFNLLLFTAVSLNTSIVGFVIGTMLFKSRRNMQEKYNNLNVIQ